MAITQAQRASLHTNLVELMGEQDAEALIELLPPGGWDNVATKDDVKTLETTLKAAITAGLAETNAAITAGLAETNAAITAGLAETNAAITAGLAEATKERAQLAVDLAKDARREAKNLYITVSTIVLATISIWIALLASVLTAG